MAQLAELVALITGASRGAGRGMALELGTAGATVYVTGRSVHDRPTTDNVPGTVDQTAAEVTDRGGRGIAVAVATRRGAGTDHETALRASPGNPVRQAAGSARVAADGVTASAVSALRSS
jgi:NAD(P)-dependent dehydrogenase (short-subunit alcohol dehydrogenase family)